MGGPSLRQLHAHHAIHEGGLSGAIDKTEEVEELLKAGEFEVARQAADHLVDYWVTRILSHADAEEEGFYEEMAGDDPERRLSVIKLTRDHDILRLIISDIRKELSEEGLTPEVMRQFQALIVVNGIHSREEERLLLEGISAMIPTPLPSFKPAAGRNDPCPCGSGLKYKKCCEREDEKKRRDAEKHLALENVLRRFFENHPRPAEQKKLSDWKNELDPRLRASYSAEKMNAIVGYTFFFGHEVRIWNEFVQQQAQDKQNAAIAEALGGWIDPIFAVLRIVPNTDTETVKTKTPASGDSIRAVELLTDESFSLRADDSFHPKSGAIVLGFWIPGLEENEPLTALNSLVLIEDSEDEPALQLEKRLEESGLALVSDFYRANFADIYERFGGEQASSSAEEQTLPEVVNEGIVTLERFLIQHDVKHDRLMDVFFRFLKRKREKPNSDTAAAAAVRFGLLQEWLPADWDFDRIALEFGGDPVEAERLAQEMLAFEQKTSVYHEEEERIGFRVGTDPDPDEFRQWQLYMHLKKVEVQGEAALCRQMDYYSRIPYSPASHEEEAQLRAYEAFLARENVFREAKFAEARSLHPGNADALLLSAEIETEASLRADLLAQAEQSALQHYERDIQPVWLHLPNRPYMRILLRRAVHEWESGRSDAAFDMVYRLLRHNPADHQGARYLALSALIVKGDFDAASDLLSHYAEGSGDNAFYRWFEWVIAYRRDRFGAGTETLFEAASEANPYVDKYVKHRLDADPYPRSSVITPRSPEEAKLIWTLLRPALL